MIHGLHSLRPDAEQPLRNVRLWDCGVTWKDINPSKGVWEWSKLDKAVRPARNYLYVLGATPQWAAKYPTAPYAAPWLGPGTNTPPADLRNWDEYVRQVVTRYKGRIRAYQIWNEPQSKHFWYPDLFTTLGTMAYRAYKIIKEIDPKALVVSPPILPRPSSGGMKRGSRVLAALWKRNWPLDVFAIHCYPEKEYGAERVAWMIREFNGTLNAMNAPHRPLWITEINYNLMVGELPLPKQINLLEATDRVGRQFKVTRAYWYAMGHQEDILGVTFTPDSLTTQKLRQLNS